MILGSSGYQVAGFDIWNQHNEHYNSSFPFSSQRREAEI